MTARMAAGQHRCRSPCRSRCSSAAGAALARVFRHRRARERCSRTGARCSSRVCCFRCCQPWNIVVPPSLTATTIADADRRGRPPAVPAAPEAPRSASWPIGDLVLIALAAGIAVRAVVADDRRVWLAAPAADTRCRSIRCPRAFFSAQERIGAHAAIYVSDRVPVRSPSACFVRSSCFLRASATMPAHVQEAIAYHELLHVRRRDWLHEILEEAVRCVLWFHPAIWWLIGAHSADARAGRRSGGHPADRIQGALRRVAACRRARQLARRPSPRHHPFCGATS